MIAVNIPERTMGANKGDQLHNYKWIFKVQKFFKQKEMVKATLGHNNIMYKSTEA